MRLAHISAVCATYENAKRFYADMLGMEEVKNFSIDQALTEKIFGVSCGCRIVCFENDSCVIEVFIPSKKVEGKKPFMHHCIEVEDREGFLSRCREQNLRINRVAKGDKFLFFLEDFDGNLYEVKEGGGH